METLEPNMYVRTKNHNGFAGGVGKIEKIQDDKTHKTKWITLDRSLDGISFLVNISEITKASYNIIDLIEVGDIIEVQEFKGKYEVKQYGLELSIVKDEYIYNLNSLHCKLNIKTIVTKEVFSSVEYRVETN